MPTNAFYSAVPTYIPPVVFPDAGLKHTWALPIYEPSTSKLTRSYSGRVLYDDNPWNSARAPAVIVSEEGAVPLVRGDTRKKTRARRPSGMSSLTDVQETAEAPVPEATSILADTTEQAKSISPDPTPKPSSVPESLQPGHEHTVDPRHRRRLLRALTFRLTSEEELPREAPPAQRKPPAPAFAFIPDEGTLPAVLRPGFGSLGAEFSKYHESSSASNSPGTPTTSLPSASPRRPASSLGSLTNPLAVDEEGTARDAGPPSPILRRVASMGDLLSPASEKSRLDSNTVAFPTTPSSVTELAPNGLFQSPSPSLSSAEPFSPRSRKSSYDRLSLFLPFGKRKVEAPDLKKRLSLQAISQETPTVSTRSVHGVVGSVTPANVDST